MSNRRRVLFVGFDSADKDLVRDWAEAGLLPNFKCLLDNSLCGITNNPPGLFVGAVWPTIYTGVSPAKHARYCYEQLKPGTYENETTKTKNFIRKRPFWNAVSEAGRKCVIIDFPHSFASELNGMQVVEWGSHDPVFGFMTWPPKLAGHIREKFGTHPVGLSDQVAETEGYVALHERLLAGVEKKTELVAHFLGEEDWDLFGVVFSESHCAGHQLWHIHDESHARHDPGLRRELGDPVMNVYRALDTALGDLLGRIGPETLSIVLCSHGMGPHYGANFMLDDILLYLEHPNALARRQKGKPEALWLRGQRKLSRLLRGQSAPPNNRTDRKCFAIPNNDVAGGIRVNLVGREPWGKVCAGAAYDEFCKALTADLLELRDAETREPLVREVYRTGDRYDGDYFNYLPDLIVDWHRERPISSVWSPKFGEYSKEDWAKRTGDHRPQGMMMARGPGVHAGRLSSVDSQNIAPTIATYLGVSLRDIDGQPMGELIGSPAVNSVDVK